MNPPLITERENTASSDLQAVQGRLEEIVAASVRVQVAQANLADAQTLARGHMADSKVRFLLLRLKEAAGLNEGMSEQWATLLRECPDDLEIVRYRATRLVKERHLEDALSLVERHLPESTDNPARLFARAKLLSDIRAYEQSDELFRRLILQHTDRNIRVEFAKRLRKRGLLADAFEVIAPVAKHLAPGSKAAELANGLASDYAFYQRLEPETALAGKDIRIVSMKHAILHFRDRQIPEYAPEKPVSVALVTGSLGPGGAERQLTRLAGELARMSDTPSPGPADAPMKPEKVEVLVKQHTEPPGSTKKQGLDFFLSVLVKARIPVTEINKLPAISVAHQSVPDGSLGRLLEQLPPPVHYGDAGITTTSLSSWAPVISPNMGPERGSWQPLSMSTVISSRAGAAMRRGLAAGTFICITSFIFRTRMGRADAQACIRRMGGSSMLASFSDSGMSGMHRLRNLPSIASSENRVCARSRLWAFRLSSARTRSTIEATLSQASCRSGCSTSPSRCPVWSSSKHSPAPPAGVETTGTPSNWASISTLGRPS